MTAGRSQGSSALTAIRETNARRIFTSTSECDMMEIQFTWINWNHIVPLSLPSTIPRPPLDNHLNFGGLNLLDL